MIYYYFSDIVDIPFTEKSITETYITLKSSLQNKILTLDTSTIKECNPWRAVLIEKLNNIDTQKNE